MLRVSCDMLLCHAYRFAMHRVSTDVAMPIEMRGIASRVRCCYAYRFAMHSKETYN